MNWGGVYNDPIYGGNISVCVTQLTNGDYVGQALFSEVGYMRGVLNSTTWTGNFYTAGQEVKQGTFVLQYSSTGTPSASGMFVELPGVEYSFSSDKYVGAPAPTPFQCFQTDAEYLEPNPPAAVYTGNWNIGYDTTNYYDSSADEVYGSYLYYYDDEPTPGFLYHPITYENGQVTAGDWYEGTVAMGIELWVAKNATAYYETWWWTGRMADFNYSTLNTEDEHGIDTAKFVSTTTFASATQYSCYMLPTLSLESSCLATSSSSSSNAMKGLDIAGIVFGIIGLLCAAYMAYVNKRSFMNQGSAGSDGSSINKQESSSAGADIQMSNDPKV